MNVVLVAGLTQDLGKDPILKGIPLINHSILSRFFRLIMATGMCKEIEIS
jgi:hypothetical protein